MRIAVALSGTDRGKSGVGQYVRAVMPRFTRCVGDRGGEVVPMGTRSDLAAYRNELKGTSAPIELPDVLDAAGPNALWHLLAAGDRARAAGADVLLLPAANRRVSARSPVPTVAVVHDLAQLRVARKYDPLRMAYLRVGVVGALRSARRLVAISGSTRDDLARAIGCAASAVRVVSNGVDARRFAPPTGPRDTRVTSALAATGLDADPRPYVLYPARLEHPGKNHVRLLGAFATSHARRTHRVVFAGSDWGGEMLIRAEVERLGLGRDVALLGHVADAHLAGLIAGADAVAMVGLWEGFGLPALEALASGRTVLAACAGALPEVVGELAALCDPLDVASIGAALDRAVSDPVLRERSMREGPGWSARFDWDTTARGLMEACAEALAS